MLLAIKMAAQSEKFVFKLRIVRVSDAGMLLELIVVVDAVDLGSNCFRFRQFFAQDGRLMLPSRGRQGAQVEIYFFNVYWTRSNY